MAENISSEFPRAVRHCRSFLLYTHSLGKDIRSQEETSNLLMLAEKYANVFRDAEQYNGKRCTVCCFLDRITAVSKRSEYAYLLPTVTTVDSILRRFGRGLPLVWKNVCILGGLLLDLKVDGIEPIGRYLSPMDIVHHYMLQKVCPSRQDEREMFTRRVLTIATNTAELLTREEPGAGTTETSTGTTWDVDTLMVTEEMEAKDGKDGKGPEEEEERAAKRRKKDDDIGRKASEYMNILGKMIDVNDAGEGRCGEMCYMHSTVDTLANRILSIPFRTVLPNSERLSSHRKQNTSNDVTVDEDPSNLTKLYKTFLTKKNGSAAST